MGQGALPVCSAVFKWDQWALQVTVVCVCVFVWVVVHVRGCIVVCLSEYTLEMWMGHFLFVYCTIGSISSVKIGMLRLQKKKISQ